MPCFQTQGTLGSLLSPLVLICLLLLADFLLSSVFFTAQRVFGTVLMLNRWPSASFPPSLFCGNGPDLLIGLQGCEWRRSIETGIHLEIGAFIVATRGESQEGEPPRRSKRKTSRFLYHSSCTKTPKGYGWYNFSHC